MGKRGFDSSWRGVPRSTAEFASTTGFASSRRGSTTAALPALAAAVAAKRRASCSSGTATRSEAADAAIAALDDATEVVES